MSKEIKCFLGKDNPSAICVNKADYIRLRNKIKETKIKSRNEALQEMEKKIKSIRLSDFEDSLPQRLLLKDIEALKKEKQEGKRRRKKTIRWRW